jgi:hypothetical protein
MSNRIRVAILSLFAVIVVTSFLPAPMRLPAVNDEMVHLQSWRNRYDEPVVYPLVMDKLRARVTLSPEQWAVFERTLVDHPLLQRVFLSQLADGQPTLFVWTAELAAALSGSSLLALRALSLAGALLCLVFLFLLGKRLCDETLGYWLASIQAVSYLTQTYAGIGRPYALALGALALTLWLYSRWVERPAACGRATLVAALLAQSLLWMSWPIVFPVVAHVLARMWQASARPVATILRNAWWYFAGTAVLLLVVSTLFMGMSVYPEGSGGLPAIAHVARGSPFAHALGFDGAGLWLGLAGLAALAAVGVVAFVSLPGSRGVRIGLIGALVTGAVTPFLWPPLVRYLIPWMLVIGIFAGFGLWASSGRGNTASQVSLIVFLAFFALVGIVHPLDPYRISFPNDTDYTIVARTLRQELADNDRWVAYPYYFSNPLYRYADLPEPEWPMTDAALVASIEAGRASGGQTFLWWSGATHGIMDGESGASLLAGADRIWRFRNRFVLARFPPSRSAAP